MTVNAIVACDSLYGIGKNGGLPWPHNEEDMKWFRKNTEGSIVVMGRKTWESIGCRPLKHRINIVVSNSILTGDFDSQYYGNMEKVLQVIQSDYPDLDVWIIGGGEIYRQALPYCDNLYLTKFKDSYDCDTFLDPQQINQFSQLVKTDETSNEICEFNVWSQK